jgi:hypothetical protein
MYIIESVITESMNNIVNDIFIAVKHKNIMDIDIKSSLPISK